MIMMPVHALWVLLGIWLAVVACAFMFGWYARAYSRAEREAVDRAVRRHPSGRNRRGPVPWATADLSRSGGRFPILQDNRPDPPPVGRWWPALERHERADTAPFSHVEVSNWEKRIKRDTDAWLHERGMQ